MEHTTASGVEVLAYWAQNEKQVVLADFQHLQSNINREPLLSIRGPELVTLVLIAAAYF